MPSLICRAILVALILQTVATNLQLVAANLQTDTELLVPPAGFEPAIYTLKGCCPGPLDDGGAQHQYYSREAGKSQTVFPPPSIPLYGGCPGGRPRYAIRWPEHLRSQ